MLQLLIVIPLILAIIIYMVSIKDGKQVCDNYILISYLYALFYICLTAYIIVLVFINSPEIMKYVIGLKLEWYTYIAFILVILILYVALFLITILLPKKFVILKHILSLIVILLGGIILSIVFITYAPDAIYIALIMTIIVFILMTIIAWKFQDYISSKIPFIVIILFFILILVEFVLLMFFPNSILASIVIFIVLLMLCYLLLVKTKRMIENSKKCKDDGLPDYVREGLSLLLSFQNILLQILQLRSRRR